MKTEVNPSGFVVRKQETAKPYNKYLIAALVLKATAISLGVALLLITTYGITYMHNGEVGWFHVYAFCTGLLFLAPNSWLSRSSIRVAGYLAATILSMFVIAYLSKPIISLAVFSAGLFSFAPLSLLANIKGLKVAKKRQDPNPGKGLWLMLGGGSGAVIVAGIISFFMILLFIRVEVARASMILFAIMFPFLILAYLWATIMRARKRKNLKTSLVYTGYSVLLIGYCICLVRLLSWLGISGVV
jgi:hypothetical protein